MIVYQADKAQFLRDNDERAIEDVIRRRFRKTVGHDVGEAEFRSWRESLGWMASVLRDDEIPRDAGVAVEYHIPQSSKRIDLILTGLNVAKAKNAVIVELKQWAEAEATKKDAIVLTYVGGSRQEVVHPSYQAWSYAALLEGFNEAVYKGGIQLRPCAYLHNYERDGIIDAPHYAGYIAKAPVFLKGAAERDKLRDFIKTHVRKGDRAAIVDEMERSKIRPSKALADALDKMLKGNPEFVLIDDQKAVFEAGIAAAQSASSTKPRVVVVEGGPGTGKSVVAINLLVALTKKGLICQYVTKNAAPRVVFQKMLTGSMTRTQYASLFSGSGAFIETPPESYDVLIVDEAHRLNEKSGLFRNLGDHQVKEIMAAAKCVIFFIDEDQRVTLKDVGTVDSIYDFAVDRGAEVEQHELASQFRCNGSDGYLAWLDHVLGIRQTANIALDPSDFDFRVFDSPSELHALIEERNSNNKARMVAGYCWDWKSKRDRRAVDIVIGPDYRRQWNLDADGSLWIVAEDSVTEVGCIHTCQGLELDYVGVIIGPDFVVRNGEVETHPEARSRQDHSLKGYKRLLKNDAGRARREADRIIKNTYRTLMTRGMKGCYVYCTDNETARHFKKHLREAALT